MSEIKTGTITPLLSPLVGERFRNPGKAIMERLPSGATLLLEPEPENPYDGSAMKVLAEVGEIPEEQREALGYELMNHGFELDEVLAGGPVWVGFLAASEGKPLAKAREVTGLPFVGNREVAGALASASSYDATLAFGPDGRPYVIIQLGSDADEAAERSEQEQGQA